EGAGTDAVRLACDQGRRQARQATAGFRAGQGPGALDAGAGKVLRADEDDPRHGQGRYHRSGVEGGRRPDGTGALGSAPRVVSRPARPPSSFPYSWTPRVRAPSITRLVPMVKHEAGLARNTTPRATSSGLAILPVGLSPSACLNSAGLFCSTHCHTPPSK